jgi:hypothetical protein
MPSNTYGRQVVEALVNKSGGSVAAGDVVIIDTTNDGAFTTTTTARSEVTLGVAQETIASNATGRVLLAGYAALVNVPASVTRGHYVETHTVAKQATGNSTRRSGSFGQFRTGGTTPTAVLWGNADQTPPSASAITRSTLGTTSVGGSFATRGMYIKKITLASAGVISAINAHMKGNNATNTIAAVMYSDSGGNPTNLLYVHGPVITATPVRAEIMTMNTTARWLTFPVGGWFAAGDYWIGVWFQDGAGTSTSLAYASGTGSDRTVGGGVENLPQDSSVQAISTGTNDYSIYADILR